MKKLLVLALVAACGCGGSEVKARNSVNAMYPSASVACKPGSKFTFVVRLANGAVRYVGCWNFSNDEISDDCELIPPLPEAPK